MKGLPFELRKEVAAHCGMHKILGTVPREVEANEDICEVLVMLWENGVDPLITPPDE